MFETASTKKHFGRGHLTRAASPGGGWTVAVLPPSLLRRYSFFAQ